MHFRTITLFLLCALCVEKSSAVIIDRVAAIVNDDVITQSELDKAKALDLYISGLPGKDTILQERIDYHLVLQQLKAQPPVVITPEEIQSAYEDFVVRHGNEELLDHFLQNAGMNHDDLMKEIRDQLSIRKFIRDRFRPFVNITIEDAEDYYEKVYKPAQELLGKTPPPFAEVFAEIQNQMVESRVQDQLAQWLEKIKEEATINVKD
jgi:peptidyl-prolyl cis-trans isomerase SurA